jgi:hypothetical protein
VNGYELLDKHYPRAKKVVLVEDNLNTHNGASLYETFPPEKARRLLDRLECHPTPKHGSWLDMAETELSILHRQCLDHRIDNAEERATLSCNALRCCTNTYVAARVSLR